jgi:hypothetical protein
MSGHPERKATLAKLQQPPGQPDMKTILTAAGAAVVAGAAVSVFAYNSNFLDVMTAMNGSLGAAVGVAAATYWNQSQPTSQRVPYVTLGAAVAVPALVGGLLDTHVVLIGAGAYAASYLVTNPRH